MSSFGVSDLTSGEGRRNFTPACQVNTRPSLERVQRVERPCYIPFSLEQEGANRMSDASQGSSGPKRFTLRTWENIVIGGLAVGALGLILPWVSAGFLSANGLDTGDGKLYGLLLLVTAILVVLWRRRGARVFAYIALAGALLMAAVAVYDVIHVSTSYGPLGISISPGIGLVFDAIAGVGTTVAIWVVLRWPAPPKQHAHHDLEPSTSE